MNKQDMKDHFYTAAFMGLLFASTAIPVLAGISLFAGKLGLAAGLGIATGAGVALPKAYLSLNGLLNKIQRPRFVTQLGTLLVGVAAFLGAAFQIMPPKQEVAAPIQEASSQALTSSVTTVKFNGAACSDVTYDPATRTLTVPKACPLSVKTTL